MRKLLTVLFVFIYYNSIGQNIDFQAAILKMPELNVVSNAKIGTPIYIYEDYRYKEGVELINVPEFKIATLKYNLPNNFQLPLVKIDNGISYYFDDKILINGWNGTYFGIAIDENNNTYATYRSRLHLTKKEIEGLEVKKIKYIDPNCRKCLKYEIIYNGKQGSVLTFNYKEYIGDLVRPAFFQEMKYDLSDGNVIGFKNLELEVLETNNLGISYKILKHL